MKKWICFLLIIGMIFSSCPTFAQSQAIEYNLDDRISPLLTIDTQNPYTYAGDITFTKDGTILLQQIEVNSFDHPSLQGDEPPSLDRLYIKHLRQNGDEIASVDLDWTFDPRSFYPFASFVALDPNGLVYTASPSQLYVLQSNLSLISGQSDLPFSFSDMFELDLLDNSALIAQRRAPRDYGIQSEDASEFLDYLALDYISLVPFTNENDTLLSSMIVQDAESLASLFGRSAYVMEVDFAETTDTLYVLVYDEGKSDEEPIWKIAKVRITLNESRQRDPMEFEVLDIFVLQDALSSDIAFCYEFDGENHQVVFYPNPNIGKRSEVPQIRESSLYRYDASGLLIDSIKIPGNVYAFDALGQKSILAIVDAERSDYAGHYMVNWKSPSTGSPKALIHERTMKGKTMAIFRDKGYGLLRKENPETGVIAYLAPLRTEERNVHLRIPLCDIVAKIRDDAQNLEILYGQDRIDIPMRLLDVRDLLSQMPCDTDATIELHLTRNDDGSVQTTAELFVIEQVNAQTKCVHRLPISLK